MAGKSQLRQVLRWVGLKGTNLALTAILMVTIHFIVRNHISKSQTFHNIVHNIHGTTPKHQIEASEQATTKQAFEREIESIFNETSSKFSNNNEMTVVDDASQHGHHAVNHTLEDLILNREHRHRPNGHSHIERKHGEHRERLLNTKLGGASREGHHRGHDKNTRGSDKVMLNAGEEDPDKKPEDTEASEQHARRSIDYEHKQKFTSDTKNIVVMENNPENGVHEEDTTETDVVNNKNELLSFEKMLHTWFRNRPKSAIYYLTYSERVPMLIKSIKTVDEYFNSELNYPIIIFFTKLLAIDMENIRNATKSDLFFQKVSFGLHHSVQKFEKVPTFSECANYTIGYRHAVRFHSYFVYRQAILKYLKYVWRIDDDAVLTEDVGYDVFTDMEQRNMTYRFLYKARGKYKCLVNLKKIVDNYVGKFNIKPTFLRQLHVSDIFVNNMEISATGFWTGSEYQKFFNNIDDYGMIYHASWSDAGIKTLALSVFVKEEQIEQLKIGFQHGDRKCTKNISGYEGYFCSPVKN